MNTQTKEKALLGYVWRSGAPFLTGDTTFRFGCGPSVGLPISNLALRKVDCKEAQTVVKPFHNNDKKSRGSPALLGHIVRKDTVTHYLKRVCVRVIAGFPGGSVVKNLPPSAGDVGSIPGLRRSPEKEMAALSAILSWTVPMNREAWWATVRGVTNASDTTQQLNNNGKEL